MSFFFKREPSWKKEILQLAESQTRTILVFCNSAYARVLDNWLIAIEHLSLRDVIVISLDRPLYRRMSRLQRPSVLIETRSIRNQIWNVRLNVFQLLLEHGIDFVHSDADAVWLRDPFPEILDANPDFDLLCSQGTTHPRKAFEDWGFVLCCGFFKLRSTPGTRSLLNEMLQRYEEFQDDQGALNLLLRERRIVWNRFSLTKSVAFLSKFAVTFSDAIVEGNTNDLNVGLLPFAKFPRLAECSDAPYVAHPHIPKRSNPDIEKCLRDFGLWVLPDAAFA